MFFASLPSEYPMYEVLKMCSATDSAPVPRNWNPLRGVRFSIPASNKKFAMFFMAGLLYHVLLYL
jgi:hypothetical protein